MGKFNYIILFFCIFSHKKILITIALILKAKKRNLPNLRPGPNVRPDQKSPRVSSYILTPINPTPTFVVSTLHLEFLNAGTEIVHCCEHSTSYKTRFYFHVRQDLIFTFKTLNRRVYVSPITALVSVFSVPYNSFLITKRYCTLIKPQFHPLKTYLSQTPVNPIYQAKYAYVI